ncbi:hypothetical protein JG688_00017213, partial [Phytophthora aleatoria]
MRVAKPGQRKLHCRRLQQPVRLPKTRMMRKKKVSSSSSSRSVVGLLRRKQSTICY